MKFLFYVAILGAVALAVMIFLEKQKKPTNVLIEDKQPQLERKAEPSVNVSNTNANLQQNENNLNVR